MKSTRNIITKLIGKSLPEIHELVKDHTREELDALLAKSLAVEPLFKPSEIAVLTGCRRRDVLKAIRAGAMGDYYLRGANSISVPASGVNEWRRGFMVQVRS